MLLYVHVPFCARRCSYCDFAIAVRRDVPSDRFADLVLREWTMRQRSAWWEQSPDVETVYFGGGTPSLLAPDALKRVLREIAARRAVRPGAEITLEANPDDVTPARAAAWRAVGVNRVSLGVQSFHEPTLAWMHRTHRAEQSGEAVRALRAAAFDNISLDLIYGLPLALGRDWAADLDRALGLEPEHLSVYALTVEAGTALFKWSERGTAPPCPDERVAEEYLHAHRALVAGGYEHYEVSNAARPGHRAVHNAGYWQRAPCIGLGPSAHSGAERERAWNIREWEAYRRAVEAGAEPRGGEERLDADQVLLEERYLGLRTGDGVEQALVPEPDRRAWTRAGWARAAHGRIRLTPEGWLRLDALVADLPGAPTFR